MKTEECRGGSVVSSADASGQRSVEVRTCVEVRQGEGALSPRSVGVEKGHPGA